MASLAGSPFGWLTFDEGGSLIDPSQTDAVRNLSAAQGVTDLVVISHGWKNNRAEAQKLYETLWTNVVPALNTRQAGNIVLAGIEWPAKAFQTDFDASALQADASGGTLSVSPPSGAHRRDLTETELKKIIDEFQAFVGPSASDVAKATYDVVAGDVLDPNKADPLFAASCRLLAAVRGADTELAEDLRPICKSGSAHEQLLVLTKPPTFKVKPGVGAAQDIGDAIGQVFAGPRAAAGRFLNQLTYFVMKKRAGLVGEHLATDVLPMLQLPASVRLHLIGHSFGARLMTAAANTLPAAVRLYSLTLLQGAFSHNALAAMVEPGLPGAFSRVVGRPTGPIAITHTHNDEACTFWYAIASRLARDTTLAIGDKDDAFGAMGANGPQKLSPEALAPEVADQEFKPQAAKVNRFLADGYIVKTDLIDAHNNVTNPTVGRLVASVLETDA